jgi:hypothetical protein
VVIGLGLEELKEGDELKEERLQKFIMLSQLYALVSMALGKGSNLERYSVLDMDVEVSINERLNEYDGICRNSLCYIWFLQLV